VKAPSSFFSSQLLMMAASLIPHHAACRVSRRRYRGSVSYET
jgi:hypothetical protein